MCTEASSLTLSEIFMVDSKWCKYGFTSLFLWPSLTAFSNVWKKNDILLQHSLLPTIYKYVSLPALFIKQTLISQPIRHVWWWGSIAFFLQAVPLLCCATLHITSIHRGERAIRWKIVIRCRKNYYCGMWGSCLGFNYCSKRAANFEMSRHGVEKAHSTVHVRSTFTQHNLTSVSQLTFPLVSHTLHKAFIILFIKTFVQHISLVQWRVPWKPVGHSDVFCRFLIPSDYCLRQSYVPSSSTDVSQL